MAGSNNFLVFGTNTGANVIDQVTYSGLTSRTNGFSAGVAKAAELNKVWRQGSVIANAIGQYIADQGYDALDNGDAATLLANLKNALAVQIDAQSGNFTIDTGAANAYVVAVNPPITAYPDGMTLRFRAANANTGASTLNAGAGAVPLRNNVDGALVAGDIPALSLVTVTYIAALGHFVINTMVPSQNAVSGNGCVQGAFKNLVISCSGASAAVNINADELAVESSSNGYITLRNVGASPSLSASGANGLDTGTSAANTWYSIWIIWNGTTIAGLFSLSATAPTMPSGYTHKARVGWCRSDGTANKFPLGMIQRGRIAEYVVGTAGTNLTAYPQISSGVQGSPTAGTYVSLSLANYIPTSTAAAVFLVARVNNGAVLVSPNNNAGAIDSANPPVFGAYAATASITYPQQGKVLLQSGTIYHAMTTSLCALFVSGWEDNL